MLDLQYSDNLSYESSRSMLQLLEGLKKDGGQLIAYSFIISLGIITFNYPVYKKFEIQPSKTRRFMHGLKWALVSFLLGWWGIPWGPIYTPISILVDLSGGHNVTDEFIQKFSNKVRQYELENSYPN